MFLRNERDMGVKNGSLGTVQNLDRMRMAVMLDDGRNVAFDLKDYAHIDHGYAATIHKAQGMTVDRVQVLATPGMDRSEERRVGKGGVSACRVGGRPDH